MNSNFPMLGGTPSMFQTITDILFRYKFIILAIVLFIILGSYYYVHNVNTKTGFNANRQDGTSDPNSNKTAEMMLFYVDWCPHCKTAKPEWENLKSEYEGKQINGYTLVFSEYNCTAETSENEELMNKYKIEGYPTIKLLKDSQVIEYDAKPTKSTMEQFLHTIL